MTTPQDSSNQMGVKVVIPCQAVGDPEPVISWMFNEKPISLGGSDGSDDGGEYTQLPSGALRIERFGPDSMGDYQCKAVNMMGETMSKPARMAMEETSNGLEEDQRMTRSTANVTKAPSLMSVKNSGQQQQQQFDHVPEDVTIPLNDSIILHCVEKGTSS